MSKKRSKSLATKPLPQAEPEPAPAIEEPTPQPQTLSPIQATLLRLLNGADPANKRESFLLLRWGRLTRLQRYALAFEWGLPFEKREDRQMAEAAMRELG